MLLVTQLIHSGCITMVILHFCVILSSANAIGGQQQSSIGSDTQIGSPGQRRVKDETVQTINSWPNKTAKAEQGETLSLF